MFVVKSSKQIGYYMYCALSYDIKIYPHNKYKCYPRSSVRLLFFNTSAACTVKTCVTLR
jgi:hypothetical protein